MEDHIQVAEVLANLLDSRFSAVGVKFGLGAFLDLVPEIGDMLVFILSLYLVWIALKMKVPSLAVAQMLGNVLLVSAIGAIPVAGDIFYILYKANLKNLAILKKYASSQPIEGQIVTEKVEGRQEP